MPASFSVLDALGLGPRPVAAGAVHGRWPVDRPLSPPPHPNLGAAGDVRTHAYVRGAMDHCAPIVVDRSSDPLVRGNRGHRHRNDLGYCWIDGVVSLVANLVAVLY